MRFSYIEPSRRTCCRRRRLTLLVVLLSASVAACGNPDSEGDLYGGFSGTGGVVVGGSSGGGGSAGAAGTMGASGQAAGGVATGGAAGTPGASGASGAGSGGTSGTCYAEEFDAGSDLSDLESSYAPQHWLDGMLGVLERRHPDGFSLMDQMKTDPWLLQDFPTYFELDTWEGMIFAVDTACHEETHGWDYEHALHTPGSHMFYLRDDLSITAPKLSFFPRNELLSYVQQGGSVTSIYDDYLVGEQGTYDFVALADEINAYINGLACATTVGDQFSDGYSVSYRDGVAAHMLFLLYYLKHARTSYPSLYAQWKADASWTMFVRYSWARARFWTQTSQPFSFYGIDDAVIWARVNEPENLVEIEQFTGEAPDAVACHP